MATGAENAKSVHDFTIQSIASKPLALSKYKGKVLLIVNTASKCGFTYQYEGLEKLYKTYQAKGLQVLGVPSNDFGAQEPGNEEEIQKFCKIKYGVTFDLGKKEVVSGSNKSDLFAFLTTKGPEAGEVKWNFEKFLVDKNGKVVARFGSKVKPEDKAMITAIEKLL